ncbi:hypothetical protein BHE74_00028798 [Ensete ventricosum]|nr:hypothetical protein GW17_00002716 [Ensete ventricosum]RWW63994.1 hypothetical protein BHE74_00028798 [Ensete ventricosum]
MATIPQWRREIWRSSGIDDLEPSPSAAYRIAAPGNLEFVFPLRSFVLRSVTLYLNEAAAEAIKRPHKDFYAGVSSTDSLLQILCVVQVTVLVDPRFHWLRDIPDLRDPTIVANRRTI